MNSSLKVRGPVISAGLGVMHMHCQGPWHGAVGAGVDFRGDNFIKTLGAESCTFFPMQNCTCFLPLDSYQCISSIINGLFWRQENNPKMAEFIKS